MRVFDAFLEMSKLGKLQVASWTFGVEWTASSFLLPLRLAPLLSALRSFVLQPMNKLS